MKSIFGCPGSALNRAPASHRYDPSFIPTTDIGCV